MRLLVPSLIIFIYIFARAIAFMPLRFPLKVVLGVVLLAVMFKYTLYEKIGGSFFAPDLPFPLLILMEALYSGMVILFVLLLVKDVAEGLLWITHLLGTSWHLPFSPALKSAGLSGLALMLAIFGTWQSLRVPNVRRSRWPCPTYRSLWTGFPLSSFPICISVPF